MDDVTTGAATRACILLVDDDEAFRRRLARSLRERGPEVVEAGSLAEAVAQQAASRPARAILDLRLGDGSGLEVLAALREADPGIACVVLTGYGSIATAVEAVRGGAVHYLTKPADADEILAAFGTPTTPPSLPPASEPEVPSLHRVEWEHIQRVLNDCDGNVSETARRLGMHRRTLQRKLATRPPRR
ncbi:MAG: response regulator [Spirochaetaceae bacterium]|nr:response regulator [Myxococcales bacterium]MCB9725934.1 response regulator [Spirochaetaceae bacterium]